MTKIKRIHRDQVWTLENSQDKFGTLTLYEVDQPFFRCEFQPTPAFDGIKEFFEQELAMAERIPDDPDLWEKAYEKIDALGLLLKPVDTDDPDAIIDDLLLHIEGEKAWFRY